MAKKVKYVRFHESPYIPGVGDFGKVIPSETKTFTNLEMSSESFGLQISLTAKPAKGEGQVHRVVVIPWPNVVVVEFDTAEDNKAATPVKKSA